MTIIDPEAFDELPLEMRDRLQKTPRTFQGVAGHELRVRGEVELPIWWGEHVAKTRVVVAEVKHGGILGLETLVDLGVTLNFAQGKVSARSRTISNEGPTPREADATSRDGKLRETNGSRTSQYQNVVALPDVPAQGRVARRKRARDRRRAGRQTKGGRNSPGEGITPREREAAVARD